MISFRPGSDVFMVSIEEVFILISIYELVITTNKQAGSDR